MVNIRKNFPKALESEKVFIVQVIKRESPTLPYAVQFAQAVKRQGNNSFLSLQFGGDMLQILTCVKSFKFEALKKYKILNEETDRKIFDDNNVIYLDDFSQVKGLNISVVENTEKNPNRPSQTPKVNPTTGEVLTHEGKPIYVHTDILPETVRVFLKPDVSVNVASLSEMIK